MQSHRLTTLPGGERVITEHIEGILGLDGLWIGAGSRDESVAKAGVSRSSSTCSSREQSAKTQ